MMRHNGYAKKKKTKKNQEKIKREKKRKDQEKIKTMMEDHKTWERRVVKATIEERGDVGTIAI